MRFAAARAARARRAPPTRIYVSLERNMQCAHRPLRALPARAAVRLPRRAGLPLRRVEPLAGGAGAVSARSRRSPSGSSPPATAASSSLLDCEDELLALAGELEIAYFLEATPRDGRRARTTSRSSRARSPPPHDAERIREVRARLAARWSRSAPARPPAASRRCATSPTSTTSRRSSTPRPDYISTLRDLDADQRARAGRLRAAAAARSTSASCSR